MKDTEKVPSDTGRKMSELSALRPTRVPEALRNTMASCSMVSFAPMP